MGPGLVGSLLVGVSLAKALAMAWGVPFVGVNHLEGHLYASMLEEPELELPVVVLLVSGGHTLLVEMDAPGSYQVLGRTKDDAAGEAYDKVARYLGLAYPGGPAIDDIARQGDPGAVAFPRAWLEGTADFSFSGLKTAVVNYVRAHPEVTTADVAASFQEAVVDVLVQKTFRAAEAAGAKGVCLAGGVAANSVLRARATAAGEAAGLPVYLPSRAMCTDNAAMIGAAGYFRLQRHGASSWGTGAEPGMGFGGDLGLKSLALSGPRVPITSATIGTHVVRVLMEPVGGPEIMKLQPLDDRIVVRPSESEETTASGLVIPDTAKEKPQQGEVLAVGPGRRADQTGEIVPLDVAVGDKVVYSKYGGTEITIDGEDLLILSSRDVLAKVGA